MPVESDLPPDSKGANALAEVQAAKERLERQALLFDTAINNMNQGLCFFDGERKLIVCNGRYAELYGLTAEQTRAGTPLQEIVAHRYASGSGPAGMSYDGYLTWRETLQTQTTASDTIVALADGRSIAIHHEPMPGAGWVATHEDVTERLRAEAALAAERERLAAALDNMQHGLSMFDNEQRLIVCNRRYADMYGLPPELACAGAALPDILAYRLAIGTGPIETAACGLEASPSPALHPNRHRIALADERIICVGHQALPSGGWVSTHEDISEAVRAEAQIAHMAHHDSLTGLPNRALFRARLAEASDSLHERAAGFALLCIDLDRFKAVNDTFGHPVGDKLLQQVADRLRSCTRADDTVARLGGDEFAIIQASPASAEAARALAARIVEDMSRPFPVDGNVLSVGASVGIAMAPQDGSEPDILLGNADTALYRAKVEGRETHRTFLPAMNAQTRARRSLERDLGRAIEDGVLDVHYQPLVKLRDNRLASFEALLRWRHPDHGPIPPSEFIPLAEETGLIGRIGEWAMRRACTDAAAWPADLNVAVNLSPLQFRQRGVVATVVSALADSGLCASRLELEITESVLLIESDSNLAQLHELRALGVRIALDDFGTGCSSLSHVRTFPFDKIKIDRTFVSELGESRHCDAIVSAVLRMGASLGITTTAEGVETADQLGRLRREGCDEVQGYLFGRPGSIRQAHRLIAGSRKRALAA